MKTLEYAKNRIDSDGFAEMFLYDQIGRDPQTFKGIDGRDFAHELRYLTEYHEPRPKEIKVRINSVGGSAMDGFSIFSAIFNANKTGKVKVNTYGDGVAASIAGLILMAGKEVYMKDYARLMLHGVSLIDENGEEVKANENDKEAMSNFKDMIKQVFKKNTEIPEEQLEELLTNGKDNWFTADEAAAAGFIKKENIENTGLEIDLPANPNAVIIANKAQKIIDSTNNLKPLQMKTVINLLGLQEGANETVVANAVKAALDNAKTASDALLEAQNKITTKDAKIQELEGEVAKAVSTAATTYVENAIKEGKFAPKDEEAKKSLVNQFVANPEGFKSMVSMMPTKAANVLGAIGGGDNGGAGASALLEKVNNRSLRELEKQDPALLAQVKNEAKGEFVKMWNAQYGTNKTEADFA